VRPQEQSHAIRNSDDPNAGHGRTPRMAGLRGKFPLAVVVCAAALILSGCSPDTAAYSEVRAHLDRDTGQVRYPLDDYALTGTDALVVERANALLVQQCMATSGLDFPRAAQDWDAKSQQPDRTFGLWSSTIAARDGYDIPTELAKKNLEDREAAQPESWWTKYWDCLDTTKQLPAMSLLVGNPNEPSPVDRGYSEALRETQSSGEFGDARSEWVGCLENEGLTAEDGPVLIPVLPRSVEARFKIALLDVGCKDKLGTMQRIADVMAQFQAAYIDAHDTDLTAFRTRAQDVLAQAREIVATSGD